MPGLARQPGFLLPASVVPFHRDAEAECSKISLDIRLNIPEVTNVNVFPVVWKTRERRYKWSICGS